MRGVDQHDFFARKEGEMQDQQYSHGSSFTEESTESSMERLATPFLETGSGEFYGFVLYLLSTLAFVGYLVWAYLPETILHQIGITYYCSRYARGFVY
jgi:hypothetical protein